MMTRKEARNWLARRIVDAPRWQRHATLLVGGLVVIAVCLAIRYSIGDVTAGAQSRGGTQAKSKTAAQRTSAPVPRPEHPQHDVMAIVNGQDINRRQLAHACVERHGEEVLESLVNKRLILHHTRKRQIEVTPGEIDAEIDRMAKRFKLGRQQWLELLEKERGINAEEYTRDILWPTLALRKLAADQLQVTAEELQEAYEMAYGPSVRARLIVVSTREKAEELHQQLMARPAEFARLAMENSEDVNSASIGGLIQPIRRHMGDPAIEQEIFALQKDQISSIIPVADQFAILKCEGHIPARNVPLANVQEELTERIKEGKLREVAAGLFEELQNAATIQNVWNNPDLQQRMPDVVAMVNGEQITMQELGDECLLRYGQEVLEVEISHLLLQQALASQGLTVTQQDLDAEIARGAELAGVVDEQGQPDFEEWFRVAIEEQGVSKEIYLRDSVWPSAALKKLTGDAVTVTENDLQKGFAANFGERIRCRAIVLHNMRMAQEVWAKARQNPSIEYFGDLAAEYSVEPTSKSLRGEVPPIRRFGGQPQLEDAAFKLQPGELSGVIQLGNRFVILRCEGRTEPVEVNPNEVRQRLYQDIMEKKLRVAMAERYEQIRGQARIDNYLAGTSQAPERAKSAKEGRRVDTAVRPTGGTNPARPK